MAAGLMWAGVAEKPEQSKMALENQQKIPLGQKSTNSNFFLSIHKRMSKEFAKKNCAGIPFYHIIKNSKSSVAP